LIVARQYHRRSQGVQWVHLHPQGGGEKIVFTPNLQGKCVSTPPRTRSAQPEQESILERFLLGGLDLEVYLDGLRGRRLKKVVNFFGKKMHPADIILATPMGRRPLWVMLITNSVEDCRDQRSLFSKLQQYTVACPQLLRDSAIHS